MIPRPTALPPDNAAEPAPLAPAPCFAGRPSGSGAYERGLFRDGLVIGGESVPCTTHEAIEGMQRYPHTATSMKIRFRLFDQSTYQL